jgi:hypothetical protein
LRGRFGCKIVAVEIEVHDILHFVCAAHHGPRWRTQNRASNEGASPVIATTWRRPIVPCTNTSSRAVRFAQSADHVAV